MKLYKYYPPSSKSFILLDNGNVSFRFSQKDALNDPFELTPVVTEYPESIKEAIVQKMEDMDIPPLASLLIEDLIIPDLVKDFTDSFKVMSASEFGILSFSKKKDHRSLWAYYGQNHTGFMLEIDHHDIVIPPSKSSFFKTSRFEKVTYTHKRPKNHSDLFNTFFIKDSAWKHEAEYRWIAPLNCFPKQLKPDPKDLPIHTLIFDRKKVKQVVIGAFASEETTTYILEWATKHSPKVKVARAVPCEHEFKFKYLDI